MNPRKTLDDINALIVTVWGSRDACPCAAELDALAARWAALKPRHEELTERKGKCARTIGKAIAEKQDAAALKAEMASISSQLKQSDDEQKRLVAELRRLTASPADHPREDLPERMRPAAMSGRTVAQPIRTISCDDTDGDQWDAYVDDHPSASLYHRYGWRELIRTVFGHETQYWRAIDRNGKTVGVLPLVRLRSRLFGDFAVSMPFFNYGGVLADTDEVRAALTGRAATYGRSERLAHIELRGLAPMKGFPCRSDKVSMIRALPDTIDDLDVEVGAKVRAQVRQAQRHPHRVAVGGAELLDNFYAVFSRNMRDLGTPVYGKAFFAEILAKWPANATLVVIYSPEAVAAAFLLGHKDLLEIPWASTLRHANAMNMNMLLYWEVLSLAISRGYRFFDFGRSSVDSGTYRFKKQWGARPVQHYWHYWLPAETDLPMLSPSNPKFGLAIAVWRRLPLSVTKFFGPHLVKYLP